MEEQTDLQRFIALYKSVGIELEPRISERPDFAHFSLRLTVGDHPQIQGYSDFETSIYFDADGKFTKQTVYE